MVSYSEKIKRQIRQYANLGLRNVPDIQELPAIFHYWSNKFILPRISEIFEVSNVFELYSKYFFQSFQKEKNNNLFLSLGCGDCSFEVGIAKKLIECGAKDFVFDCYELSPRLIAASIARVNVEGLSAYFLFHETDLNSWQAKDQYCGVMAHQALHHVVELEHLFENVKKAMLPGSVFVVSDMIGRNGHMRWPEMLEVVNAIWAFMPDHQKKNRPFKRFEELYLNHDCSADGFEGIRSQDILPNLLKYFNFDRFLAYGGLPDVFIERSFGHNYDPENVKEKAFVDFLEFLNCLLIDLGYLKPTMIFAVLSLQNKTTKHFKHWTPDFCVRVKRDRPL